MRWSIRAASCPKRFASAANGQVNLTVPRNSTHGLGYVIYGLAGPQGNVSLAGTSGVLAGATPTAANNGTAARQPRHRDGRLFTLRLNTTPVTLPAPAGESNPVRDVHADGDTAMFKIDGGVDLNDSCGSRRRHTGQHDLRIREFHHDSHARLHLPDGNGNVGTGVGALRASDRCDAACRGSALCDGPRPFDIETPRRAATAVRRYSPIFDGTIYVDRLPPEAAVDSFAPKPATRAIPIVASSSCGRSTRRRTTCTSFSIAGQRFRTPKCCKWPSRGQGSARAFDRSQWNRSFVSVTTGNHVATVVTFEPTYDGTRGFNVQRFRWPVHADQHRGRLRRPLCRRPIGDRRSQRCRRVRADPLQSERPVQRRRRCDRRRIGGQPRPDRAWGPNSSPMGQHQRCWTSTTACCGGVPTWTAMDRLTPRTWRRYMHILGHLLAIRPQRRWQRGCPRRGDVRHSTVPHRARRLQPRTVSSTPPTTRCGERITSGLVIRRSRGWRLRRRSRCRRLRRVEVSLRISSRTFDGRRSSRACPHPSRQPRQCSSWPLWPCLIRRRSFSPVDFCVRDTRKSDQCAEAPRLECVPPILGRLEVPLIAGGTASVETHRSNFQCICPRVRSARQVSLTRQYSFDTRHVKK